MNGEAVVSPNDFKQIEFTVGVMVNGKLMITRHWDTEQEATKALRQHLSGRVLKVTYEVN